MLKICIYSKYSFFLKFWDYFFEMSRPLHIGKPDRKKAILKRELRKTCPGLSWAVDLWLCKMSLLFIILQFKKKKKIPKPIKHLTLMDIVRWYPSISDLLGAWLVQMAFLTNTNVSLNIRRKCQYSYQKWSYMESLFIKIL